MNILAFRFFYLPRQRPDRKGVGMTRACARHILVGSRAECEQLKVQIEAGADFAVCARKHSLCPTAQKGGDLGAIKPGQLIREFDECIFGAEVGKLIGPVETAFGYHLIEIIKRS